MSRTAADVYQRHRLTIDDYHRMGKAGVFKEAARVELMDGEVINMAPVGSKHAAMVARVQKLLEGVAGDQAIVWTQNPIVLDDRSEPQPDISLLHQRDDFYASSHPRPQDVLLIVEVSDTTLRYDREVKAPVYARADIQELWVIGVESMRLEMYRQPGEDGYREVLRPGVDERVELVLLPGVYLNMASLFDSINDCD